MLGSCLKPYTFERPKWQHLSRYCTIKSFTAKQILAYLTERNAKIILDQRKYYKKSYKGENRKIQLWPESVHPQMILDEAIMCQKVDYIHQDLVKKGFVDDALVLALGTKINF